MLSLDRLKCRPDRTKSLSRFSKGPSFRKSKGTPANSNPALLMKRGQPGPITEPTPEERRSWPRIPQLSPSGSAALDQLQDLIGKAKRAGAEAADAVLIDATALSVAWRDGKVAVAGAGGIGYFGLRVLIGQAGKLLLDDGSRRRVRASGTRGTRRSDGPRRARRIRGLAAPEDIAQNIPSLIMADAYEVSAERLIDRAREAEAAAMNVKGVAQCESADASASRSTIALAAADNGFAGHYSRTGYGVSASAIAAKPPAWKRITTMPARSFNHYLPDAAAIGRSAGERAAKALNARKMPTCQVPVVFDPRESGGPAGQPRGRDFRHERGELRHQLSERQAGPANFPRRHHGHRRPVSAARPALQGVRWRGPAAAAPRHYRQGGADDLVPSTCAQRRGNWG